MGNTTNKKKIYVTIAVIVLIAIAVTAYFSLFNNSTTAAVMRLTSTVGEVELTDDNKNELSIAEDMRLFSGNSVETGNESYAYISLDETKAVKLDEESVCTLIKNDKELEVIMLEGDMFFNVSAPLKEDELFNIRTSTMVTSIRGTSGYVNYVNENITYFTLFTGKVEIFGIDNTSGAKISTTLKPGETAITEFNGTETTVEIVETQANNLPSFVVDEILKDDDLTEESLQQSGIDFRVIEGSDDNDDDIGDNDDDDDIDDNDDDDDSGDNDDDDDSDDNDDIDDNDDNDDDDDINDDINDDSDDVLDNNSSDDDFDDNDNDIDEDDDINNNDNSDNNTEDTDDDIDDTPVPPTVDNNNSTEHDNDDFDDDVQNDSKDDGEDEAEDDDD